MKKAKSRIKKKVTVKTVVVAALISSGLWSGVFYLLLKPQPVADPLIIEKIVTKEIEKVEDFVPSPRVMGCMEKRPGVTGDVKRKFGKEWRYWAELIGREACLDPAIINTSSGACGLAQALPCEKMECSLDMAGVDCQLDWIEKYVGRRYGTIQHALVFHDIMNYY